LKISRRKPGAPLIYLKLTKIQEITPTLECPKVILNLLILFKILFSFFLYISFKLLLKPSKYD